MREELAKIDNRGVPMGEVGIGDQNKSSFQADLNMGRKKDASATQGAAATKAGKVKLPPDSTGGSDQIKSQARVAASIIMGAVASGDKNIKNILSKAGIKTGAAAPPKLRGSKGGGQPMTAAQESSLKSLFSNVAIYAAIMEVTQELSKTSGENAQDQFQAGTQTLSMLNSSIKPLVDATFQVGILDAQATKKDSQVMLDQGIGQVVGGVASVAGGVAGSDRSTAMGTGASGIATGSAGIAASTQKAQEVQLKQQQAMYSSFKEGAEQRNSYFNSTTGRTGAQQQAAEELFKKVLQLLEEYFRSKTESTRTMMG